MKTSDAVRVRWRFILAALVAMIGVLELAAHYHFSTAAPAVEDWRVIRPTILEQVTPGTLVLVSPRWAEPNARFALGDAIMPLEHVARPDESRFARALEISILGGHAEELQGWELGSERRQAPFLFRTWTNPNVEPVVYDFLARAEPPNLLVNVEREGKPLEACPFATNQRTSNGDLGGHPTFPRRRFVCPGAEWAFVGRTVIEDHDYRPRQCIWAHPRAHAVLSLRFDPVPIGNSIRGYGALPYLVERERRGSPIELSVVVGGELVGTYRHVDGDGWKGFQFSTERFRGQSLPVEFQIRSKRESRRDFCFQADVR